MNGLDLKRVFGAVSPHVKCCTQNPDQAATNTLSHFSYRAFDFALSSIRLIRCACSGLKRAAPVYVNLYAVFSLIGIVRRAMRDFVAAARDVGDDAHERVRSL